MKRTPLHRSRAILGSVRKGRDPRRFVTTNMKKHVLERDGYTCHYCGGSLGLEEAVADHVVPWKDGGRTEVGNLVAACRDCNRAKGNMRIEEFREKWREVS